MKTLQKYDGRTFATCRQITPTSFRSRRGGAVRKPAHDGVKQRSTGTPDDRKTGRWRGRSAMGKVTAAE